VHTASSLCKARRNKISLAGAGTSLRACCLARVPGKWQPPAAPRSPWRRQSAAGGGPQVRAGAVRVQAADAHGVLRGQARLVAVGHAVGHLAQPARAQHLPACTLGWQPQTYLSPSLAHLPPMAARPLDQSRRGGTHIGTLLEHEQPR